MKSPLIAPSHRGLLHEHLGIPEGERIGRARLEEAKRSSNPAIRKEANFALNFNDMAHHGEVTSVGEHHSGNGKYAVVHVAHGPRPKPPKPKKGENSPVGFYDDRPTSSVVMPKEHAKHYRVGMKVGVMAPPTDPDGDPAAEDDMDMDDEDMRSEERAHVRRLGSASLRRGR